MIKQFKEILEILKEYKNNKNKDQLNDLEGDLYELSDLQKAITTYCDELKAENGSTKKLELFIKLRIALLDIETYVLDQIDLIEEIMETFNIKD